LRNTKQIEKSAHAHVIIFPFPLSYSQKEKWLNYFISRIYF